MDLKNKLVAFVADVHLANHKRFGGPRLGGVNTRASMVLEALVAAIEVANAQGVKHFVVLGDLVDVSNPTPQLLSCLAGIFTHYEWTHGAEAMQFHLLMGNHELVSEQQGDNALDVLRHLDNVSVYEGAAQCVDLGELELLMVPFQAVAREALAPQVVTRPPGKKPRILCVHMGVSDGNTPFFLQNAGDSMTAIALSERAYELGCSLVMAGNWHSHAAWVPPHTFGGKPAPTVIQCGALVPTGFDNPGMNYGYVITVGAGSGDLAIDMTTVPGPRFLSMLWDSFKDVPAGQIFLRLTAKPSDVEAARLALKALREADAVLDGEVLIDAVAVRTQARSAAAAARHADSTKNAVAEYVEHMLLPDDVDRVAVLAFVEKCLIA